MTSNHSVAWKRVLAEFLAIFAGVVLGLLADDWRQAREARVQEALVLNEILADLERDSTNLAGVGNRAQLWGTAGLWVGKHRGSSVDSDSAATAILPLFFTFLSRPQSTAFAGLRDAGELDLIRDRSLRRQVVEYFEDWQPYVERFNAQGVDIFLDLLLTSRRYLLYTVPPDAESLRDRLRLDLVEPWAETSSDPEFSEALVRLGTYGASLATVIPRALEANVRLRNTIGEYLRSRGSV